MDIKSRVARLSFSILVGILTLGISSLLYGQNTQTVSGTVANAQTGAPMIGVNILVVGTSMGTATDVNGHYSLNVSSLKDTLRFSFIGFKTKIVPVNGRTTINIELTPIVISGEQLVVIGYGTRKQKNLTGAVSHIPSKALSSLPVTNFVTGLEGQIAGVRVQQVSGRPGGTPLVKIRGTGSITASSKPLYVIDGFPYRGNLTSIAPADIKSIDILKGASASAIYGSRAANGVVLITTKKGHAGNLNVNVQVKTGFQRVTHQFDVLNAKQYVKFFVEARNNGWTELGGDATDPNSVRPLKYQIPPSFKNPASFGEGTNWQDLIFQTAPLQQYNLSFSGGNSKIRYYISGNFTDQQGIIQSSGIRRYSFLAKMNVDLAKNIRLGVELIPTFSKRNYVKASGHWGSNGLILSALNEPPIFTPYNHGGGA